MYGSLILRVKYINSEPKSLFDLDPTSMLTLITGLDDLLLFLVQH